MQMNVIRGERATGKTTKLRELARAAGLAEEEIIHADFFEDNEIEMLVRNRLAKGAKVVCINDCYEATVTHLARAASSFPADVVIHAVVRP